MTTIILDPEAFDAPDMQRETEAFIDWCKQSPHDARRRFWCRANGKRPIVRRAWRRAFRWMPAAGRPSAKRRWKPDSPAGTGAVSAQNALALTERPGVLLRHRH
jgi:hypothetical protein